METRGESLPLPLLPPASLLAGLPGPPAGGPGAAGRDRHHLCQEGLVCVADSLTESNGVSTSLRPQG